jgi:hypothetical protein
LLYSPDLAFTLVPMSQCDKPDIQLYWRIGSVQLQTWIED